MKIFKFFRNLFVYNNVMSYSKHESMLECMYRKVHERREKLYLEGDSSNQEFDEMEELTYSIKYLMNTETNLYYFLEYLDSTKKANLMRGHFKRYCKNNNVAETLANYVEYVTNRTKKRVSELLLKYFM